MERDIRLLDAGDGRRLERFGERIVDRPHPAAVEPRAAISEWRTADLRFDRGAGWVARDVAALASDGGPEIAPWAVDAGDGLRMELRATPAGGIGLFPEQLDNVEWLGGAIRDRSAEGADSADGEPPAVLNLFAHTGLLTLAAARAGAAVTHVDASRPAVAWARRNAELSSLTDAPIRWIVDEATAFTRREARRGRRYDGIVLDPPSYGHGGKRAFEIESELPALLEACEEIATPNAFVLLSAHSTGLEPERLVDELAAAFDRSPRGFETVPLTLEAGTGASLPLGFAIRSRG
jgi:23S rRNA (cytosine1962-C5)-methyltransferase